MKNSSYYIAPAGDRTHDLPHAVASNMDKVSHALTHSATARRQKIPWPTQNYLTNSTGDKSYQLKRAAEDRKRWHDLVVNLAQETTFQ